MVYEEVEGQLYAGGAQLYAGGPQLNFWRSVFICGGARLYATMILVGTMFCLERTFLRPTGRD